MPSPLQFSTCLYQLATLAAEAGALILETAGTNPAIEIKNDGTPVSQADTSAHRHIIETLSNLHPQSTIISEETPPTEWPEISDQTFFLIDPLDGTKEFLAGRTDYTVNIAIIENGIPVSGVVHAPALGITYIGALGKGAAKAINGIGLLPAPEDFVPITTRPLPETNRIAFASRSHRNRATEELLASAMEGKGQNLPRLDRVEIVGSSLKFVKIAEGSGDYYPRLGVTREWDTAAGHAILIAAGGTVTTFDHKPMLYGKRAENYFNEAFIARG